MSTRRLLAALACLLGLLTLAACGEDPNAPGEDGEPLLISAAERGDLPAIDALLARKALPDVRDACDWTPLMKAALEVTRRRGRGCWPPAPIPTGRTTEDTRR